ncbi:MAG: class II SORL domain-containing protein [Desulfomonilaceae bacterium]|nr:class II SORL domain-containing protein [Desulfomonilaceae bacterium]
MAKVGDYVQTADWKSEKHVPVIDCPDNVPSNEMFDVRISLGKEIAHPNTTDHHIRWIQLFFKPEGDKFAYQIGNFEFTAHGESVDGPDTGPVYSNHSVVASMKTTKPGTLTALSLCNIHGLWEFSKSLGLK